MQRIIRRVEILQQPAAADARSLRLDHVEHQLQRDGRIERVTAAAQIFQADLCGERIGGHHHLALRLGRLGRCALRLQRVGQAQQYQD